MFCPNCGQKINIEQTYCRSCGAELSETSRKLSKYFTDLEGKTDWAKRVGLFSSGVVLSVIFLFLFVLFVNAFRVNNGVIVIFLMIFSVISAGAAFVLYFEKRQAKKLKSELLKDKNFALPLPEIRQTDRQLNESSFAPISSVTDNTTELFTAEFVKRKTSGELS